MQPGSPRRVAVGDPNLLAMEVGAGVWGMGRVGREISFLVLAVGFRHAYSVRGAQGVICTRDGVGSSTGS